MSMTNREVINEGYNEVLETTLAVKEAKRQKVDSYDELVAACSANSNLERIGGMAFDSFTKSMICQVHKKLLEHEKGPLLLEKYRANFLTLLNGQPLKSKGRKMAIVYIVDRFWKLVK